MRGLHQPALAMVKLIDEYQSMCSIRHFCFLTVLLSTSCLASIPMFQLSIYLSCSLRYLVLSVFLTSSIGGAALLCKRFVASCRKLRSLTDALSDN